MSDSWVDRYRPETFDEIQGHNADLDSIRAWADGWESGDQGILLTGPPGIGKTTTAEVVANHLNVDVIEINASSARTTDDLNNLAQQIRTVGPDGRRLILIDEVDSWHHSADKTALYDALDAPANPVVMTANDSWEVAGGLQSRAEEYEFKLRKSSRRAKLRKIAEAEGADLDENEIDKLAERPDLRSAINDLQMAAEDDLPPGGDQREWETSEWDMLDDVLTGTPDIGTISPPDALMWLDESTSAEYRGLEMAMAYEAMAMADVRLGVAEDRGYRHWKYAHALLEEVALIRVTEPYYGDEVGYNSKSFPEWFRHSKPNARGGSAEAKLYRSLKGGNRFEFAGDFIEFETLILPILRELPKEERFELIISNRLTAEEYEALNVSKSEYEDWVEVEQPELGEWEGAMTDASEW